MADATAREEAPFCRPLRIYWGAGDDEIVLDPEELRKLLDDENLATGERFADAFYSLCWETKFGAPYPPAWWRGVNRGLDMFFDPAGQPKASARWEYLFKDSLESRTRHLGAQWLQAGEERDPLPKGPRNAPTPSSQEPEKATAEDAGGDGVGAAHRMKDGHGNEKDRSHPAAAFEWAKDEMPRAPVQHLRLGRFLRQEHIERAAMEFTKAQEACAAVSSGVSSSKDAEPGRVPYGTDPYPVNDTLLPYTTKFCYWRFIGITKKELHQQTNIDLDANTVAWVFPRSRMQDIGGEALRRWETGYSKTRSQEFVIRECIRELIQDSIYAVVEFREKKEARKRDKEEDYHLEGKRISGQKRRLEGIIVEKMRVQILEELVGRRGFVGLDVAGIAPLWSKERLLEIRRECCVVGTGDGSPEEPDAKLLHEKLVAEMGLKEDSLRRLEIVNEPRKEAREAKAREERRKWRLERERLEREQFELSAFRFGI
eukprot:g9997.t1